MRNKSAIKKRCDYKKKTIFSWKQIFKGMDILCKIWHFRQMRLHSRPFFPFITPMWYGNGMNRFYTIQVAVGRIRRTFLCQLLIIDEGSVIDMDLTEDWNLLGFELLIHNIYVNEICCQLQNQIFSWTWLANSLTEVVWSSIRF